MNIHKANINKKINKNEPICMKYMKYIQYSVD